MAVIVSSDGKILHASGCPFIHDKAHVRTIMAREALKEGYVPCVRCMKKYLQADLASPYSLHDRRAEASDIHPRYGLSKPPDQGLFGLRESRSPTFYQSLTRTCNFHLGAASLVGRLRAANLSNEEM
jgi:hypothetical protein